MNPHLPDRPLSGRDFVRYLIAGFQVLAGSRGLYHDWKLLLDPGIGGVLGLLIELLLVGAGFALIFHPRSGRRLTIVAQALQAVGLSTPGFTWMVIMGVATRLTFAATPSDVPGESVASAGVAADFATRADFALGHPHPDHEGYLLSINLVAILILLTAVFLFRAKRPAAAPPG